MSVRDPPNLRRCVGWGVKKAGKLGYRSKGVIFNPKHVCG